MKKTISILAIAALTIPALAEETVSLPSPVAISNTVEGFTVQSKRFVGDGSWLFVVKVRYAGASVDGVDRTDRLRITVTREDVAQAAGITVYDGNGDEVSGWRDQYDAIPAGSLQDVVQGAAIVKALNELGG